LAGRLAAPSPAKAQAGCTHLSPRRAHGAVPGQAESHKAFSARTASPVQGHRSGIEAQGPGEPWTARLRGAGISMEPRVVPSSEVRHASMTPAVKEPMTPAKALSPAARSGELSPPVAGPIDVLHAMAHSVSHSARESRATLHVPKRLEDALEHKVNKALELVTVISNATEDRFGRLRTERLELREALEGLQRGAVEQQEQQRQLQAAVGELRQQLFDRPQAPQPQPQAAAEEPKLWTQRTDVRCEAALLKAQQRERGAALEALAADELRAPEPRMAAVDERLAALESGRRQLEAALEDARRDLEGQMARLAELVRCHTAGQATEEASGPGTGLAHLRSDVERLREEQRQVLAGFVTAQQRQQTELRAAAAEIQQKLEDVPTAGQCHQLQLQAAAGERQRVQVQAQLAELREEFEHVRAEQGAQGTLARALQEQQRKLEAVVEEAMQSGPAEGSTGGQSMQKGQLEDVHRRVEQQAALLEGLHGIEPRLLELIEGLRQQQREEASALRGELESSAAAAKARAAQLQDLAQRCPSRQDMELIASLAAAGRRASSTAPDAEVHGERLALRKATETLRTDLNALGGQVELLSRAGTRRTLSSAPRLRSRPAPEAVLFLDVDGVLHSLYGDDLFRDSCCKLLEHILRSTGAAIVLSSSWRMDNGKVTMLNGLLQQRRLEPIYDCTVELDGPREAEICEWLDRHPGVTQWAALDDMDLQASQTLHAWRMRGHFVQTNSETGLVPQDAEAVIHMLVRAPSSPASPTGSSVAGSPHRQGHALRLPSAALAPMGFGLGAAAVAVAAGPGQTTPESPASVRSPQVVRVVPRAPAKSL